MDFLINKFFDSKKLIKKFITKNNELLCLESNDLENSLKKEFRDQFLDAIVKQNIIPKNALDEVTDDKNPWSIDFPGWFGEFDEKKGKKIFIIGSEPHIHHPFLQTVYGLNRSTNEECHDIFKFLNLLLKSYLNAHTFEEVLKECYITDLIPLGLLKGNGNNVGTTKGIQKQIGNVHNWVDFRFNFAKFSLKDEIKAVKPKIILTQGKIVFEEVCKILEINTPQTEKYIQVNARKQYVRKRMYGLIPIISVPHIGSRQTRYLWNNYIEEIIEKFNEIVK